MNGMALQEQLEEVRMKLLMAIEALPDGALVERGAVREWSIADFMFLLSAWEAELVTGLMNVEKGKKPGRLLNALKNRKNYNTQRLAESPGRELDLIFNDLQKVRVKLEGWIEIFSDKQLTNPKQYKWLKGQTLSQLIAKTSFQFEENHIPTIEVFAEKWLATPRIAMGSIEVLK